MGLDTAYFIENWKLKIIFGLLFSPKHCSFAYLHCSCPMNSAIGAGFKKKKKKAKMHPRFHADAIQTLSKNNNNKK